MSYHLDFLPKANQDIAFHKKSGNKTILKKMLSLLIELAEHPQIGTGKPEKLKHDLTGYWSRRISKEHRLIYKIYDSKVVIYSMKGHY